MNSIDPDVQALLYFKDEQYRNVFCKLPMVLLTNTDYATLTNNARVAYALLTSRFELSYKNNWIDDAGAIYFYYTTKALAADIHVSERTAVKVRQELVQANLLNIQKQGLHKPARLYLLKPVIDKTDFDKIDHLQSKDIQPAPTKRNQKGQLTRDAESAPLEETLVNQQIESRDANSASLNMQDLHTRYINKQIKQETTKPRTDTLKTDTLKTDTIPHPDAKSQQLTLDQALDQYQNLAQRNSIFSPTAFNLLQLLAQTHDQTTTMLSKTIFKAKNQAFHDYGLYSKYLDIEAFPKTIEKTLYRITKQVKHGQIKTFDRYFFKAFQQEFKILAQKYLIWLKAQPDQSPERTTLQADHTVTEAELDTIDAAMIKKVFG